MRLGEDFFTRDALVVAPELLGITIKRNFGDRTISGVITEVEAYRGEEDLASHARFGKTKRNEVMYERGGLVYVYLVYGLHWMLNIVTGKVGESQAVLIRGIRNISGPGKVTKFLKIDRSLYGEDVTTSQRLWFESTYSRIKEERVVKTSRIGVGYAGEWANKPWRWIMK